MNFFGFFRELADCNNIKIAKSYLDYKKNNIDLNIINYLKNGNVVAVTTESYNDELYEKGKIIGPQKILSDGDWIWRADTPYYVEKLQIEPPKEFIDHMKRLNYIMPSISEEKINEIVDVVFGKQE